jgi:hypothetical protein
MMTVPTVVSMPKKGGPVYQCDEHRIDELLDIAGIAATEAARSDLEIALWLAQSESSLAHEAKHQPTPKRLRRLEQSITKTLNSLAGVREHGYASQIGLEMHRAGAGVVEAQFVRKLGEHKELPTIPEDAVWVLIDIQRLLCAWLERIKKVPRRKRANPGKPEKDAMLRYAQEFFIRYSSGEPKKFTEFSERFFEAVIGKDAREIDEVTGKLDWQKRKLQKQRRVESLIVKKRQ